MLSVGNNIFRKCIMATMGLLICLSVWLGGVNTASAAPITEAQAKAAVANWLSVNPAPLNEKMGNTVGEVVSYKGGRFGTAGYYLVLLEPVGWAVLPADDRVGPILAFGSGKRTKASYEQSTLYHLMRVDLADTQGERKTAKSSVKNLSQKHWETLLSDEGTRRLANSRSISVEQLVVLIPPLLGNGKIVWEYSDPDLSAKTNWDEFMSGGGTLLGTDPFEDGRPSPQYVAGCVPTAMGQFMYYLVKHQYPHLKTYGRIQSNNMSNANTILLNFWNAPGSLIQGTRLFRTTRFDHQYHWDLMPDSVYQEGSDIRDPERQRMAREYASPLLRDLGISVGVWYLVSEYDRAKNALVRVPYDAVSTLKEFGFAHGIHIGMLGMVFRGKKSLQQVFETNLDYGHPVQVDVNNVSVNLPGSGKPIISGGMGHAYLVDGYAKAEDAFLTVETKGISAKNVKSYYHLSEKTEDNAWLEIQGFKKIEESGTVLRVLFNVFPEVPTLGSTQISNPEIISGRVVLPPGKPRSDREGMTVRVTWDGREHGSVPVDPETGIYSLAAPPSTLVYLRVMNAEGEPHPLYTERFARMGISKSNTLLFSSIGNAWGIDFLPPSVATTVTAAENPGPVFEAAEKSFSALATDEMFAIFANTAAARENPASEDNGPGAFKTVVVASDPAFDTNNAGYTAYLEHAVNAKAFVEAGGTLIATGKSTMFPATMGGSAGPKFHQFTHLFQPYGKSVQTQTTIMSPQIQEHMSGVGSFWMQSTLPQAQHSVMSSAGNARVLSKTSYLMQVYSGNPWGSLWNYDFYDAPNAVEYNLGENGGRVIYMNGELSQNFAAGSLSRAFVEAIVEPILHEEEDEEEIEAVTGGDYASDPSSRLTGTNQANLNMVVYRNGITVGNNSLNEDISLVFTVSERMSYSVAPQIDAGGETDLVLNFYNPAGELYATRSAISGDSTISIGVPAADNTTAGAWRYVVEHASGIDGNRVVLVAAVGGLCDINMEALGDYEGLITDDGWGFGEASGDVSGDSRGLKTVPAKRFNLVAYPRGVVDGVFHHQLGDSRSTLEKGLCRRSRSVRWSVRKMSPSGKWMKTSFSISPVRATG